MLPDNIRRPRLGHILNKIFARAVHRHHRGPRRRSRVHGCKRQPETGSVRPRPPRSFGRSDVFSLLWRGGLRRPVQHLGDIWQCEFLLFFRSVWRGRDHRHCMQSAQAFPKSSLPPDHPHLLARRRSLQRDPLAGSRFRMDEVERHRSKLRLPSLSCMLCDGYISK
ncbi:hypothetical protein BC567DRAFT_98871 [Phyllosticta citribraziliensis]